ncbi:MAG: glucuronate isomerase [Christensenellaceae bacterium]|jgi:glucuronate isomerase|nr:glucuronate isomerase [Christensenellaceae bacterium]
MNIIDGILKTAKARKLYQSIAELPILDYHCHLEAEDIYVDSQFNDISEIWLKDDHYKWRLMRQSGEREMFVTGNASSSEKFYAYIKSIENAIGNPTRDWSLLELDTFFGIKEKITTDRAHELLININNKIKENPISPRKILKALNVKYIATTDDPTSDLKYHSKLMKDKDPGFNTKVTPTFRVDKCFNIKATNFNEYITSFNGKLLDFKEFLDILFEKAKHFVAHGCVFSDIGIEVFPYNIYNASHEKAEQAYNRALSGDEITDTMMNDYISYLYLYWFEICLHCGFTIQLHLGVIRNANRSMYSLVGADSGFDIAGGDIDISALKNLLNRVKELYGDLPNIIAYVLNPTSYHSLIILSGAFKNLTVGVPWWFNDHKKGLVEYFDCMLSLSNISTIPGMTTDGRSYLAYVRHAYFRAVLANYLASQNDYLSTITNVAKKIAYQNMADRLNIQD